MSDVLKEGEVVKALVMGHTYQMVGKQLQVCVAGTGGGREGCRLPACLCLPCPGTLVATGTSTLAGITQSHTTRCMAHDSQPRVDV